MTKEDDLWVRWFAHQVRSLRQRLGMTQGEFAKAIGIGNRITISVVERAEMSQIPTSLLIRLLYMARKQGIGCDEFLVGFGPFDLVSDAALRAEFGHRVARQQMRQFPIGDFMIEEEPPDFSKGLDQFLAKILKWSENEHRTRKG